MVDADFRHLLERLPRGRKGSNRLFEGFRGLGKLQRLVLTISEASESFRHLFWRFPRPRKAPPPVLSRPRGRKGPKITS